MPIVAFHASQSRELSHLLERHLVVFDSVQTNVGGAYSTETGKFVAPVPGVYVFSTSLLGHSQNGCRAGIVRNGHVVVRLFFKGMFFSILFISN